MTEGFCSQRSMVQWALTAILLCATSIVSAQSIVSGDAAWSLLEQPGHHAIMRHALAPGTGDPSAFVIDDCSTQRNLSPAGRADARRTGERIASRRIRVDRVLSSQWCRCVDTATLLGLEPVEPIEALNSSWLRDAAYTDAQTAAATQLLTGLPADQTAVLVTHAANILALTGYSVSSGGILILEVSNGNISVVGEIDGP